MSNNKIILVDDEIDLAKLLKFELETEGYVVSVAHDGKTGLELVKETKPDLVLLDVSMPGMDGYEVLKILKADQTTKGIPVIMLTAKGMNEDIQKGLDSGADDYIPKPFHAPLLVKKIQNFF